MNSSVYGKTMGDLSWSLYGWSGMYDHFICKKEYLNQTIFVYHQLKYETYKNEFLGRKRIV